MSKNDTCKIVKNIRREDNFSFSKNTTYGCGGFARTAYFPKSIRQATAIYDYLISEKIKFVILGNGSNVLASDNLFNGSVISTKNLSGVYRTGQNTIFCRAGTKVNSLLKFCCDNGFGGLEFLAGIPASIGGLAFMNGGTSEKHISQNILSVKIYDGEIHDLSNKCCNFGHKYSIMRDINSLILGVELLITLNDSENVRKTVSECLAKRSCQPKGKSCGCVFKNVGEHSAGKIIDDLGLKGLSFGKARVSEEHANFIINYGDSSSDVYALINEVKQKVLARTGILLEEEVVYIGDF